MHRAHWSTESIQKVGIPLLLSSASLILTDATESNVWTQFSRWLGLQVWSCEEENHEAVEVDNRQEDPERGQQQRGTIGKVSPLSEPQEQTAQISVEKEPIIDNSQGDNKLEDLEEEMVIMRNTKADAPNITFNRPKNVGRRELYLVATFGIVLQLGVLLFFGLITYYPTLSYQKDGKTVVAYACPLAVIGTIVLVLGMLLCSHVVDSTTREDRYEAARGKTAQMVWLQQETTVSDQLFSSVALFPPQTSKVVTTSSRVLTENPTEHGTLQKTVIETKAIIGTGVGLLGFIIQFIGLRGMHWSASIAQLIALAIMTALRAWVRRGFTDELRTKRLFQSYELDWFAVNIGDPNHVFWSKPTAEPASKIERTWEIVTRGNGSQYEALQPMHIESQLEVHDGHAKSSSITNRFNAQGIMNMRRDLAKLTNWHSPVREQAIRLTQAIEVVMNSLFASKHFEVDDQSQGFVWILHVEGGPQGRECIQLHVDRGHDSRIWNAYADEVEAVLSLWSYSTQSLAQSSFELDSPRTKPFAMRFNVKDDIWLRSKGPRSQPALRLVGPYTRELHRDLGWWIPDGPFDLLKVAEIESGGQERSTKLEVERRRVVGCGASYERSNQITVSSEQPPNIPWDRESMDRYTSGHEQVLLSDNCVGPFQDDYTETKALAVEFYDTNDKLYALDLLSAFMWAAAKTLKTPIDDHSELQHSNTSSERADVWKFFTLKSKSLSNLVQRIHDTGLGTLQDIYLSIVPPLSISHKLPEMDAVVELVSRRANKFRQLKNWEHACNEYIWLSRLGKTFPPCSLVYSKATALLLQFQRTLVEYLKSKGLPSDRESRDDNEDTESVIRSIERHLKTVEPDVVSNIKALQKMQRQPCHPSDRKHLRNVNREWLAGPENVERMHFTETHRWTMSGSRDDGTIHRLDRQEIEKPDVMGWRPLHYTISMGQFKSELLLKQGADPNVRDNCGCTPMHYLSSDTLRHTLGFLKDHDGDLNSVSTEKRTPLHYSAIRGNLKLTKYLIAGKADTRIRDIDGRTPIHLAAIQGKTDIVTLLEGDAELVDNKGQTPLHLAALNGQLKVAEKLVQIHETPSNLRDERNYHMPIHFKDGNGETPLLLAVKGGSTAVVEFLIEHGANVNDFNDDGTSPLYVAVENDNLEITKALLKAGIAIENETGKRVFERHVEPAKTLLEAQETSSRKSSLNELLKLAVFRGHCNITKMLLEAGANANGEIYKTSSPLFLAVRHKHPEIATEIAKLLLEAGASANTVVHDGDTVLHIATEYSDVNMAKLLLEAGACVNSQNKFGRTPMAMAVVLRKPEFVEAFIQFGADINIVDIKGKTVLDHSLDAKYGSIATAEILERAGGVRGSALAV